MKAVEHNHAVPPEELMAYLDGELEPERALVVHAHLANCGSCEALAAELRHTSSDMALWEVPAPVQSLQPPASPVGTASKRRSFFAWLSAAPTWQFAGALAVMCRNRRGSVDGDRWWALRAHRRAGSRRPHTLSDDRQGTGDSCAARWLSRIGHRRRTGRLRPRKRREMLRRCPFALNNSRRVSPQIAPRRSSAP